MSSWPRHLVRVRAVCRSESGACVRVSVRCLSRSALLRSPRDRARLAPDRGAPRADRPPAPFNPLSGPSAQEHGELRSRLSGKGETGRMDSRVHLFRTLPPERGSNGSGFISWAVSVFCAIMRLMCSAVNPLGFVVGSEHATSGQSPAGLHPMSGRLRPSTGRIRPADAARPQSRPGHSRSRATGRPAGSASAGRESLPASTPPHARRRSSSRSLLNRAIRRRRSARCCSTISVGLRHRGPSQPCVFIAS